MTHRRLPATKPGPRLENQRGEEVRPACEGKPEPFDALMDYVSGPAFRAAQEAARAICARCPIVTECHDRNRDEVWARAITKSDSRMGRPVIAPHGTISAYSRHLNRGETPCGECRAANAAHARARRAKAKEAAA